MSPSTREPSQKEIGQLLREVERYLLAVDVFRAEGCEPVWGDGGDLYLRLARP